MVLFVGQVARGHRDREAFQEIDFRAMFGPLSKWAAEVDDVARLPEYVNRAFHVAMSGRPGPVVLALPEDMLCERSNAPASKPTVRSAAGVAADDVEAVLSALKVAERPLAIAGGSGWSRSAAEDLRQFAEVQGMPVAVAFRRQDYMDNASPKYAGDLGVGMNPKLARRLEKADCLLLLGTRLGDIATGGYRLIDSATRNRILLHVHPDPDLPGSVFRADLAVAARAPDMLAKLAQAPKAGEWTDWCAGARADYEAWRKPRETPGKVKMEKVVTWLSEHLPDDAIVTNGAGNYAAWLHRYYQYRRFGTQLAPTSGSMGYGFPAAVAASLAHPDRLVVCLAGDGCFQMTLNEMSTAMQHGARIVVIVAENGGYGTIRMHQERHYPGRKSGTDLVNPDFAALARAYGGHGETVTEYADFPEAYRRAEESRSVAVIELKLDPEALSTERSLSEIRATAVGRV